MICFGPVCEKIRLPPMQGSSRCGRRAQRGSCVVPADARVFRSARSHSRQPVVPANTGVFRTPPGGAGDRCCGPRRRGGDPPQARPQKGRFTWFPPTRGCSDRESPAGCGGRVVPADAGMFRRGRTPGAPGRSDSRRCGGVPPRCTGASVGRSWFPPTRGSSGVR